MVLSSYPCPAYSQSECSDLVPGRKCLPGRSLVKLKDFSVIIGLDHVTQKYRSIFVPNKKPHASSNMNSKVDKIS